MSGPMCYSSWIRKQPMELFHNIKLFMSQKLSHLYCIDLNYSNYFIRWTYDNNIHCDIFIFL